MIVDASVVLRGFFPDEEGYAEAQALIRAYAQGEIELHAPTLLPYEMTNAVLAYDRSAYDGAYLALAEEMESKLVTGDRRLYKAVKNRLPWVLWIEDYAPESRSIRQDQDKP